MSNDVLEMPKKKPASTGRIILVAVVILAVLGLVAWRLLPGDKTRELTDTARRQVGELTDAARRQVDDLVDKATLAEAPVPGENLRVSTVGEATTPGRVDGSLTGAGAPSVPASSGEGDEYAGKGASDVPAAEEEGNVVLRRTLRRRRPRQGTATRLRAAPGPRRKPLRRTRPGNPTG